MQQVVPFGQARSAIVRSYGHRGYEQIVAAASTGFDLSDSVLGIRCDRTNFQVELQFSEKKPEDDRRGYLHKWETPTIVLGRTTLVKSLQSIPNTVVHEETHLEHKNNFLKTYNGWPKQTLFGRMVLEGTATHIARLQTGTTGGYDYAAGEVDMIHTVIDDISSGDARSSFDRSQRVGSLKPFTIGAYGIQAGLYLTDRYVAATGLSPRELLKIPFETLNEFRRSL